MQYRNTRGLKDHINEVHNGFRYGCLVCGKAGYLRRSRLYDSHRPSCPGAKPLELRPFDGVYENGVWYLGVLHGEVSQWVAGGRLPPEGVSVPASPYEVPKTWPAERQLKPLHPRMRAPLPVFNVGAAAVVASQPVVPPAVVPNVPPVSVDVAPPPVLADVAPAPVVDPPQVPAAPVVMDFVCNLCNTGFVGEDAAIQMTFHMLHNHLTAEERRGLETYLSSSSNDTAALEMSGVEDEEEGDGEMDFDDEGGAEEVEEEEDGADDDEEDMGEEEEGEDL